MPIAGGTFPRVLPPAVYIAFTTNPGQSPAWTLLPMAGSGRVRKGSIRRGRQYEQDRFQPGKLTLVLDNSDRRYDPTNTASPYYPNVLPMRRIKVVVPVPGSQNNATIFDGYIDAWPQEYAEKRNEAHVTLTASDAIKVLSLSNFPGSVYEYEVRKDNPVHWWRLGESQGGVALDGGSSPVAGTFSGTVIYNNKSGVSPYDSTKAVDFSNPGSLGGGYFSAPAGVTSGNWTIEFWLQNGVEGNGNPLNQAGPGPTNTSSRDRHINFLTTTGNVVDGSGNFLYLIESMLVQVSGVDGSAASISTSLLQSFATAGWHHIVLTKVGTTLSLYLDGVVQGTATFSSTVPGGTLIGPLNTYSVDTLVGLADIAIYNTGLSASRVAAHYNGAVKAWAGETSDVRIGRALDQAGFSSTSRTIDSGVATLGAADLGAGGASVVVQNQWGLTRRRGKAVRDHIEEIEIAEGGDLFIDAAGNARFYNRHHLITAPGNVSQATFGDAGAGSGELGYSDIVTSYDDTHIYNDVRVTRLGGTTQLAADATSQGRYEVRTFERSNVQTLTDNDSLGAAQWLLNHYKSPVLRVEKLTIQPRRDPANLYPQVLQRELLDRVTVKRRPPGGGSPIVQDCLIEGINHDFSTENWTTTWQLSPAEATQYLFWDKGNWDAATSLWTW